MNIERPVSSPSTSHSSSSIFQKCMDLHDRLSEIPNYVKTYIDPISSNVSHSRHLSSNPIQKLWNSLRQAAGLCHLVNMLKPGSISNPNMPGNISEDYNNNSSKANMYHFLRVCKLELNIDEHSLFSISDAYRDDMSSLLKIINSVNVVLDMLEDRNLISSHNKNKMKRSHSRQGSQNTTRDNVLQELVETEKKYVSDLEEFQNVHIAAKKVLKDEYCAILFSNLDSVLDFQRRFLIALESSLLESRGNEMVGNVFIAMKKGFKVYLPYCANHTIASDFLVEKKEELAKRIGDFIDVNVQLPSFLIKPIQRICKYPLLLQQLVKSTAENHPDYNNLVEAWEVSKEITDQVNESTRIQENIHRVIELEKKVDDWRGHDVHSFGALIMEDRLIVSSNGNEKEMLVCLFEKIITIFKETAANSLLKRKSKTVFHLKGHIYINSIESAINQSRGGPFIIKIFWREDELASFALKFRTEEQLNIWYTALENLIEYSRNPKSKLRRTSGRTRSSSSNDLASTKNSGLRFSSSASNLPEKAEPIKIDSLKKQHEHARNASFDIEAFSTPPPRQALPPPPDQPLPVPNSHFPPAPNQPLPNPKQNNPYTSPSAMKRISSKQRESSEDGGSRLSSRPASSQGQQKEILDLDRIQEQFQELLEVAQSTTTSAASPITSERLSRRCKISYNGDRHSLYISVPISFKDIYAKIKRKLNAPGEIKIKYKDEDGDLLVMNNDEDVNQVFEDANQISVNLFVVDV